MKDPVLQILVSSKEYLKLGILKDSMDWPLMKYSQIFYIFSGAVNNVIKKSNQSNFCKRHLMRRFPVKNQSTLQLRENYKSGAFGLQHLMRSTSDKMTLLKIYE